jgi:ABC-type transporter Mla MlaB component
MLKITVESRVEEVRLKLEGDIAGPWVHELEACWRANVSSLVGRSVCVELTDVSHVDDAGRYLLALIAKAGARMVSKGVANRDLLDSIVQDWLPVRIDGTGWSATPTPRS